MAYAHASPSAFRPEHFPTPTAAVGKGIKGFFSRVTSPTPGQVPSTGRSRLTSFIDDATRSGAPSRFSASHTKKGGNYQRPTEATERRKRTSQKDSAAGKDDLQRTRRGSHSTAARPATPTDTRRRHIRFNPTALPPLQRGDDGKWQPPSLSRGSMSTSALHQMQDDELPSAVSKKGTKHALSGLFQPSTRGKYSAPAKYKTAEDDLTRTIKAKEAKSPKNHRRAENHQSIVEHNATQSRSQTTPLTPRSPLATPGDVKGQLDGHSAAIPDPFRVQVPPTIQPQSVPLPPEKKRPISLPTPVPRSQMPSYSRPTSDTMTPLSRDHFMLRLSASFIVEALTPIIRGPAFVQNEKNAEMNRLADDKLSALIRMEKAWGADWAKSAEDASNIRHSSSSVAVPEAGTVEKKIRAVHVGERTKDRERKNWADSLRNGILLCLLFNHLFPANPSHITRVSLSDDGITRSANVSRFIAACQLIGVSESEVFRHGDITEGSEISLGRVSETIIALARLSGPKSKVMGRSQSPSPSPGSTTYSRPPSRTGGSTPNAGAPVTPVRATSSQPDTVPFKVPPSPVTPRRPTPFPRSAAQPAISPIRAKSPGSPVTPVSPSLSRSSTPVARQPSIQLRPVLRPRNTTGGSRSSVSFVSDDSSSIPSFNEAGKRMSQNMMTTHSRERTPSLVTSDSRPSTGYSLSSGVMSVATMQEGEEVMNAIDLTEESESGTEYGGGIVGRRMSGKTLHEARQRILGTLLSSDDLPQDIRNVIESGDGTMSAQDVRDRAISTSLAALEGNRQSPRPGAHSNARQRPSTGRVMSKESGRGEVDPVVEEDEYTGQSSETLKDKNGQQAESPTPNRVVKNPSDARGIYLHKQPLSPPSGVSSPTDMGFPRPFPAPQASYRARDSSPSPTASRRADLGDRVIRPQSAGYIKDTRHHSYSHEYSGDAPSPDRTRPPPNSSMVDLSGTGHPNLVRGTSAPNVVKSPRVSQTLQVLDFQESGRPLIKYQLGNCIGRGQFGSVYRSLNLGTGQMSAIKRIRLHGMPEGEVKDVMREVALLRQLSHPSIVKYEGMSRDEQYLNIVLEFVENGSLGQTLKSFGTFSEQLTSSYVAKILEGLDYLHSQGVVHCDLKAANILSTKSGNIKLSDFGVSLNMKAVENMKEDARTAGKANVQRSSGVAGTPNWMAPEVISLAGATFSSDIWSLGCTIIELLTGKPPYSDIANSMTVLFRIVEDAMPPLPEDISANLTDFLELCFTKDPVVRPSAAVFFEHPWVTSLNPPLKALQSQDSLPFLRRVSQDLQRASTSQLFEHDKTLEVASTSKDVRLHGRDRSDVSLKAHTLVKTTFGKAIACRVCQTLVKKGVICQECGMIAHCSCASVDPARCDIHEQLAIISKQQKLAIDRANPDGLSSRESFDGKDGPLAALPGKILLGLKRSRALSPPSRTSSQIQLAANAEGQTGLISRASMETVRGSQRASLQNRSSAYSSATEYGDLVHSPERGVHLDLDDPPPASLSIDEIANVGNSPVDGERRGRNETKEGKSDCLIQ